MFMFPNLRVIIQVNEGLYFRDRYAESIRQVGLLLIRY